MTSNTNTSGSAAGSADAANTAANTATSSPTFQPRSQYRIVKDDWGSRTNFQGSHGLKMDPDDLEEGDLILEGYRRCELTEWQAKQEQRDTIDLVVVERPIRGGMKKST
ncbi:hypothetical protein UCDDA912_g09612 [Diaporthe ampelina]|uniref:Uncharacterized protein n=1 Tax=Diaporthe ampelina TaxID=1214573 RepID=A0A0G2F8B4_9PEZI|nr:hypothetical protein UCDDA912_g09612 [Diaporthe ampelina]